MPTPILYTQLGVKPLDRIPEDRRWNPRMVFYATNREREPSPQRINYSNREGEELALGLALVGFGGGDLSWENLNEMSGAADREVTIPLTIAGVVEAGRWAAGEEVAEAQNVGLILDQIGAAVRRAKDSDLLIYVHGAKVNFYNSCVFTAQLDHFMGREMTSLAFAWPTRQNILSYAWGDNKDRAYRAGGQLAYLLELLARETDVRRIHLLAWSAGGRVTTEALRLLHERHGGLGEDANLDEQLKIGTVYLAAADVPREEFFRNFRAIEAVVGRVIVSTTDHDNALMMAKKFMGDGLRIGQSTGMLSEEEVQLLNASKKIEVIDVSAGARERGFNISGHRYWIDHPWANTDVLLAVRSDFSPEDRGLVRSALAEFLWVMPPDYPERLGELLRRPGLRIRALGKDSSKEEGEMGLVGSK